MEQLIGDAESGLVVFDRQLIEERDYWLERLTPEPGESNLRLDYSRPETYASDKGVVFADIKGELYDQLMNLTDGGPFLLYTTLMAALKICLNRYTGNKRIVVGSPSRRRWEDVQHSSNPLPILDDISENDTFRQTLLNIRDTLLEAYARQQYPFERLVSDLGLAGVKNKCPLFDVALELTDIHARLPEVRNDLTIRFNIREESIEGRIEYNARLFSRARVERFKTHYEQVLRGGLKDSNATVMGLEMSTAEERRQLLPECPDRHAGPVVSACIHELFEQVAERAPGDRALEYEGSYLSYGELNARANQLARRLRGIGVQPETLVGIYLERGIELVICILAVMKAGGAYVHLDLQHPRERTEFMMNDSGAAVLLTEERLIDRLPEHNARVVKIDGDREKIACESRDNPVGVNTAQNLAYLIYTSGSTGKPKAVMVEHGNLTNVILTSGNEFNIQPSDVMPLIASFSFDISLFELLMPLLAGGVSIILGHQHVLDLEKLTGYLERITLLHTVPSLMRQIVNYARDNSLEKERFKNIRTLFIGGDLVPPDLLEDMKELFPLSEVNVLYGPTEATIICSSYTVPSGQKLRGHVIGKPFKTTCLHLYDKNRQLVPIGVRGEIYITGVGVSRGYLNAGDLTGEKYVTVDGQRFYRTGDLACYLPDGNIEFLGRIDDQVKIRGFRIELREIEACLSHHEAVEENVVVVREDKPGDKRLVAYIVGRRQHRPSSSDLRGYLKEKLPEYMVPSAFVILESLPLTPNRKVDRRALPAPDSIRPSLEKDFTAPRTDWERFLARVWEEVLSLDRVGIHDNFFDLGGDSIKAVVSINKLQQAMGIKVHVAALFDYPYIVSLAAHLRDQSPEAVARLCKDESESSPDRALASPDSPGIPACLSENKLISGRRGAGAQLPLSFSQQRLWVFDQLEPGSCTYNIPSAVRLTGSLNVLALEQSFGEIVRRHESLRTTFDTVAERPVQVIAPPESLTLPLIDLSGLSAQERDVAAYALAEREAARPFNLSRGPLLRLGLIKVRGREHLALATVHHIVSDAWSMGVFTQELVTLYEACSTGTPSTLAELTVQYADYSLWQREWLRTEALEGELSYWKKQLDGMPPILNLRSDKPRPAVQSYHGGSQTIVLPQSDTESLRAFSRGEDVTLFMTMMAVFNALLYHHTGQQDLVLGANVANRNRVETRGLIGFFVNQLVLRTDLSGDPTFRELVARVRKVTLEAYAHQDIPFEKLVEAVRPERSLTRTPLFQVKIDFNSARPSILKASGLSIIPLDVDTGPAHFDLTLAITNAEDTLSLLIYYNSDLFEAATVSWMLEQFVRLCEYIVARPEVRLSELAARLSQADRERQSSKEKEFKKSLSRKLKTLKREVVGLQSKGRELS